MPAEWEPHEATWIAWPHEVTDWPGKFAPIPHVYCEIVRHLSQVETVRILVESRALESRARTMLKRAGAHLPAVEFFVIPTDRSWCRDFCPIFVRGPQGNVVPLNWRFNGWAKYSNSERDNDVPQQIASQLSLPLTTPECDGQEIVLEGGSIDVNGLGSLLTTEECLLSPIQARNPHLSQTQIEAFLASYLGARNVLWLRNGIIGDDTHGHIDDLARFTGPSTIVIATENDPGDPNHGPLLENLQLLREMKSQNGQPFSIETLPMPEPVYFNRQRLPASYANFYIANKLVLVPTFNDANDRVALNKLAELFPDRKIVGISCVDLVLGLGTLHCMTQQQPA